MHTDYIQLQYHSLVNLALVETQILEQINVVTNWDKFKDKIDSSFSYLKKALSIVQGQINKRRKNGRIRSEGIVQKIIWNQQYITVIINIVNLIFIEAVQFKDKKLFESIVRFIERGQKYYEQCKETKKLKDMISKTYYMKASAFYYLQNYTEAERYYKKDYEYCKMESKNMSRPSADFKKSQEELVKLMIYLNRYDEAIQYAQTQDLKQEIRDCQRQDKNYLLTIKSIQQNRNRQDRLKSIIREASKIDNQQLSNKKCQLIVNILVNEIKEGHLQSEEYICNYYSGVFLRKLSSYKDAESYILKAQRLCKKNTDQQLLVMIQKAYILDQSGADRQLVKKLYDQCIRKAKLLENEQNIKTTRENRKVFEIQQKRKTRYKIFEVDDSKFHQDDELQEISQNTNQYSLNRQNKKISQPVKLLDKYHSVCKQLNLSPNLVVGNILTNLNSLSQFPFQQFFHFHEDQLTSILSVLPSVAHLDLRNHQITKNVQNSLLNKLSETKYLAFGNDINEGDLSVMLEKCVSLKKLKLNSVYCLNMLRRSNPLTHIVHLHCLNSLSIDNCRLSDKSILFLNVQKLVNLQELSIADNYINGSCLVVFKTFQRLSKLNLSGNPLNQYCELNPLKTLKIKRMVNYINEEYSSQLFSHLMKVKRIDISENSSEYVTQILSLICEECTSKQISNVELSELIINNVQLVERHWGLIGRMILNSVHLRNIEINKCGGVSFELQKFQTRITNKNIQIHHNDFIEIDKIMDCE